MSQKLAVLSHQTIPMANVGNGIGRAALSASKQAMLRWMMSQTFQEAGG